MEMALFVLALVAFIGLWQMMAISVFWGRFSRALQAQEPATARLAIHAFGPDDAAVSRALAHHTRLDLSEIDEIVEERRTGPLPLPLSSRRATLLAAELRDAGAVVEVEARG